MKETEGIKDVMVKRKDKEIKSFAKKDESETRRMLVDAKKDLTKESMQESGEVKEAMVKRKGKETEYLVGKGESQELIRMHMEAKKDLTKDTLQESEDVKEAIVKRKGKEIEYFVDKGEGEEPKRMHMEAKKDLAKDTVKESEDVKQAMIKRKGKEIDYFLDEGEGKEPKRMHMEAKKVVTTETMQETEDVKEVMVKRKDKEIENFGDKGEGEEPRRKLTEAKKELTKEKMKESEDAKEAMVKRKGQEIEYFMDKGEGGEPKRMHMEAKKDLTTETTQETEVAKEVMAKRKDKEIENFVDKEPKRMHMEAKKDLTKESTQENENVKEPMVKRKGKVTEYFLDKGEGEEPQRMFMEAKKDLTKKTMQKIEDVKEATIKRKGNETEYFVDQGEGKEPKSIHMEARNDLTKETMQEVEYVSEAMVKRKGKEIDSFVDKGEGEELKRTHMEAKKGVAKETMQEEIERTMNGNKDNDQQYVQEKTVKRKFEVPTEEFPRLVGGQDESRRLKVAKMEEQKEMSKEAMAETESLIEKMKGEKSKNTKEASTVTEKSTATEILQKETEESNIERKSRDGPYVPDNMVKVVFEVLGTFQAKLPKQVMEAISQNKKDKNEYVVVKLKGEGSIKMHVEPNEAFDEDETGDRIEKEIRKPKLKSSDQISGKENVDVGVFDGSKRPKFPEIGETEDDKEDSAKIEESVKKVSGDKYEKIQVEEKGGLRKDTTRESTQKEREGPGIQTMEKYQHRLQEEVSKGRIEASKAIKEEFPMKMVDSLADKREGLKETKIDEAKQVKGELVKQRSQEKKIYVKEKDAEIEQSVKKVKGEKYEKIQVEAKGGLKKDKNKEKDQQRFLEGMSKGRYEASTTAREFPMQIVDSLAKTREGTKDKEIEEVAKRKSEETEVVESTTEEKVQEPESERTSMTFKEVPEDKHPKVLEIGSPERELQSTKGPTTRAKVVSVGFKEVEQESAKDKTQKTKLLPPTIQSKETHESKNEGVKQDIIKPKKAKKVEGEQITEELARFPSTQQAKVEEKDKLYEGGKAETSIESQKEDPTTDMKNLIEMKENQESKQRKTLKPEISLEKHLKKEGKVTRKDEFHKGQKVGKTMQEETEGPKEKIVDRDQQYVQRDVAKGVGKVDTSGKEMPKKENVADELAQATATHSKEKSEIDKPQVNQLPSPSIEMWSKEPHELDKHGMKENDSKAENLVQMQEGRESIHSIEGSSASEVGADEVAEPSKVSSSSSTQPCEVEEKDKTDASSDQESQDSEKDSEIDGQESTNGETDQEIEQGETLQQESPADIQCIDKYQEESHGIHEIEEEKGYDYEQGDEAGEENSQVLEEHKECDEEATEGKKNDQKGSKKLFVSFIIAGSTLLASGIFLFIRHKRATKSSAK